MKSSFTKQHGATVHLACAAPTPPDGYVYLPTELALLVASAAKAVF